MTIANGLFAVLNEQRQVVAVNDTFLRMLGIEDTGGILGLRPGEIVHCIHCCDTPGGCGTSEYCASCGAVLSMLSAIETRQPQERTCALSVERDSKQVDLYFSVRSCPLIIEGETYLLFFMQDNSVEQQRACLERTFFHDINNILCGLVGKSEILAQQPIPSDDKVKELQHLVLRIAQEVSIQNSLQKSLDGSYKPLYSTFSARTLLGEIEQLFQDHPLSAGKKFLVQHEGEGVLLITDFHLVSRIVVNMVTNALEATPDGGTVRLYLEPHPSAISFHVWNEGKIPDEIALHIFQRNFSTKETLGRGFGTYSMKLFGEDVLGGMVGFETSAEAGTTFTFTIVTQ
ncbi:sensor histidine kinase [Geomesophilobacter sediminis]|uniref:PAS domain-containing protein n=1 Tax=Geomesophilobacter sediminis TaxID=2798584 RepID=A0A8J7IQ20_9BACT|nr:ATP-binding protein [Geomesophilobacter sediminis]MBJ6724624.1 PAS domain-containing protein [Geomesophilobacter sediminis]